MKMIIIGLILVYSFTNIMASETIKGMQKDYELFKTDMQIKLAETEKKINELKLKAQAESTVAQEKSIVEYEQKRDQLKTQLEDMEKAGESKWKRTKRRLAESIDKLNKLVQKSLDK